MLSTLRVNTRVIIRVRRIGASISILSGPEDEGTAHTCFVLGL